MSKDVYVVLVTMQYSDYPQDVFGPFDSFQEALDWENQHVGGEHFSDVQRLKNPHKEHEFPWWKPKICDTCGAPKAGKICLKCMEEER